MARALACNPKTLIANAPSTGQDVSLQAQAFNLSIGLQANLGIRCLFVDRDLKQSSRSTTRCRLCISGRSCNWTDAPPYSDRRFIRTPDLAGSHVDPGLGYRLRAGPSYPGTCPEPSGWLAEHRGDGHSSHWSAILSSYLSRNDRKIGHTRRCSPWPPLPTERFWEGVLIPRGGSLSSCLQCSASRFTMFAAFGISPYPARFVG